MLVVYEPVSGEMKYRVLSELGTCGHRPARSEVKRLKLLAFRNKPRDLVGLFAAEAKSHEIPQPRFGCSVFVAARNSRIILVEYRVCEHGYGFGGDFTCCSFSSQHRQDGRGGQTHDFMIDDQWAPGC